MIVHNVQQGSYEWKCLRAGKVTASCADKILTPSQFKKSSQQEGYLNFLLAEWLLGEPIETDANQYMQRGKELEPTARNWFEFEHDVGVRTVGFISDDDGHAGCSPDGIIDGQEIGLEIKTPGVVEHVANLRDMERAYFGQVQASMAITGFAAWWLVSFNPRLPSRAVLVERDDEYVEAYREAVYGDGGFLERLERGKRELVEMGFRPPDALSCRGLDSIPCGSRDGLTKSEIGWLCSACAERYAADVEAIFGGTHGSQGSL